MRWFYFLGCCFLRSIRPTIDTADAVLLVVPVIIWVGAKVAGYEITVNAPAIEIAAYVLAAIFLMRLLFIAPYQVAQTWATDYEKEHNTPISKAIRHLCEKSEWGKSLGRSPRSGLMGAALELRQGARDDRLSIQGRIEIERGSTSTFAQVWSDIPPEHWQTHEIDIQAVLGDRPHWPMPETRPENVNDVSAKSASTYTGLRVDKRELKNRWPAKPFWLRCFDKMKWVKEWPEEKT